MVFFTIFEIIDIAIMTFVVGFIFSDTFRKPIQDYDPLKQNYSAFNWTGIRFAIIVTAPAIILHELSHKITALYFGLDATFHAAYFWLVIGLLLKLINFGFIFFVPGYVEIGCSSFNCNLTPLMSSFIAFSGPFLNLVLWLGSWLLLRSKSSFTKARRNYAVLYLTQQINMFLFIFNMIPLPFFDGYKVFDGLIKTFF